jgi:serine protein kinase
MAKTEPGDENNQDISALVGKVDIRKLENSPQNDPMPMVIPALVPCQPGDDGVRGDVQSADQGAASLLTATQEGNYNGTEGISALPFNGIILAHSNESEWVTFRNNKNNEAFLDRIYIVKVPYCLRVSDESQNLRQAAVSTARTGQCAVAPLAR